MLILFFFRFSFENTSSEFCKQLRLSSRNISTISWRKRSRKVQKSSTIHSHTKWAQSALNRLTNHVMMSIKYYCPYFWAKKTSIICCPLILCWWSYQCVRTSYVRHGSIIVVGCHSFGEHFCFVLFFRLSKHTFSSSKNLNLRWIFMLNKNDKKFSQFSFLHATVTFLQQENTHIRSKTIKNLLPDRKVVVFSLLIFSRYFF